MADFDKVIPPGQEGEIKVKIYGNKIHSGRFKKSYTVKTNDPENEKVILYVAGEVEKVFGFSKPISLSGFGGEELSMETVIDNMLDEPIRITGYRWSEKGKDSKFLSRKLGVEVREYEAGQKYGLKVWKTEELGAGHYLGDIILTTDFERLKEKKVSVRVTVTPDVEVHPKTIYMREMRIPKGKSLSFDKTFRVIAARGDSLKVLEVIPDREDITVSITEKHPGKAFEGVVRVRPPSRVGRYLGSLKIITNYPGYEEIRVNITGSIRPARG